MTVAHILIFGEGKDQYDSQAIEHLVRALVPPDVKLKVRKLRFPIMLDRGAARKKQADMAQQIAGQERAARIASRPGERVIVVGFHDCDEVEPAHIQQAAAIEQRLRNAGVQRPVAATPAWCIETWWMLFPDALASTRRCWRPLNVPAAVGKIPNAKNALRRALRPTGHQRCPDYDERDSPTVARFVSQRRPITAAQVARSASLAQFRDRLLQELA